MPGPWKRRFWKCKQGAPGGSVVRPPTRAQAVLRPQPGVCWSLSLTVRDLDQGVMLLTTVLGTLRPRRRPGLPRGCEPEEAWAACTPALQLPGVPANLWALANGPPPPPHGRGIPPSTCLLEGTLDHAGDLQTGELAVLPRPQSRCKTTERLLVCKHTPGPCTSAGSQCSGPSASPARALPGLPPKSAQRTGGHRDGTGPCFSWTGQLSGRVALHTLFHETRPPGGRLEGIAGAPV